MICRSCTSHGVFADGLRFYSLLVVFSAPPRRHRAFQKYKEQIERLYEKLERSHPSAAGWRGLGSTCGRLSGLWRDSDTYVLRLFLQWARRTWVTSCSARCCPWKSKMIKYETTNIEIYATVVHVHVLFPIINHVSSWSILGSYHSLLSSVTMYCQLCTHTWLQKQSTL